MASLDRRTSPDTGVLTASGLCGTSLAMLVRYKAWADKLVFDSVMAIPQEEALRPRPTTFGNMVQTLSHVFVVDDIFRHHLLGRPHAYTARILPETPDLPGLRARQEEMDRWYIGQVDSWSEQDRRRRVDFEFVGGGVGEMTREEIVLHVINHTPYHRGFVGDMLKQVPYAWPANDLTVFLRDFHRRPSATRVQG
jgi:uncharacterized damage-inducible protein DinB